MPTNKEKNYYNFMPWLRRGLARRIEEVDTLDIELDQSDIDKRLRAIKRAQILVSTHFELTPTEEGASTVERTEMIPISIVGPGDVTGIKDNAILQVVPANGLKNFESNYYPFIEFFEEDLPWRYTPASPDGVYKLKPWITLIICKKEEFTLHNNDEGLSNIRLNINNDEEYLDILGLPEHSYYHAHVQVLGDALPRTVASGLNDKLNQVLEENSDNTISRILSSRKLEDNTAYYAFLIPTYETGRLSGLGLPIEGIYAQKSAWEKNLDLQKEKHIRALDLPIYYQWEFETSTADFAVLVRRLQPVDTDKLPAGLKINVSNMGNGLNYADFQQPPLRRSIDIHVATKPVTDPIGFNPSTFPANTEGHEEKVIYDQLMNILSHSPDFAENEEYINTQYNNQNTGLQRKTLGNEKVLNKNNKNQASELDDPWVVPPVYGAKHILAQSLAIEDHPDQEWFNELNLDIRHRIAAGLGKKVVQNNQEDFVQRAWEQIELINELNQKLKEYLLQKKLNDRIYRKGFTKFKGLSSQEIKSIKAGTNRSKNSSKKFMNNMINTYYPIKFASTEETASFNKVLSESSIPTAFASGAFQQLSNQNWIPQVSGKSLMDNIVDKYIIEWKEHEIEDLITVQQIQDLIDFFKMNGQFLNTHL